MDKKNKIPQLETKRLLLKEISLDYIESYKKYFIDYEVIRYLSGAVPWPFPEDGIESFLNSEVFPNLGKTRWDWGIFLKDNPTELIGVVDLWSNGNPENRGFWLGKQHWGNGYMTEACQVVNDFAFNEQGFEKLVFANAVGNERSRRVKEKNGAKLLYVEAADFVDPQFTEHEVWELTKSDWEKCKSNKES
jgi:ribosomal-protein-alanine N-acetyltransferase